MKLSHLIRQLQDEMDKHGDHGAYIETENDEDDIRSIVSHHLHGDPTKERYTAISMKEEE